MEQWSFLAVDTYEPLNTSASSIFNDSSISNDSSVVNKSSSNGTDIDQFLFYQKEQVTILSILLLAIAAGNSTVLLALLLTKARKSRMNFFIMQLAFADLLVGLISVLPDLIQRLTISWLAGSLACKLIKFSQGVVTYSSTYVLVALSIDRCDAITHPMNFTGSWRRARMLICSAWLISIVMCLPMLFLFNEKKVQDIPQCHIDMTPVNWRLWITSIFVSLFVVPALTISACYGVIVSTIRQKSRRILGKQNSEDAEARRASSRGIIPKAKIKTVKMTFVIVFVFVLCWSPYMIYSMLQVYDLVPRTQSNVPISSLIQSLAPLNSAANPIIYLIFSNRIFFSLRNIPPYKWLCCPMKGADGAAGNKSKAHTELLTSSHRRTKRDLTIRCKADEANSLMMNHRSQCNNSGRKVRVNVPNDVIPMNNNCHTSVPVPRRQKDTCL